MKSLIWQSVMWRPGKARFLIDMKNPLPIRPAPTARQHGPLRGRAVRQIRDVSRATPSLRHASGDTFSSRLTRASHPDRRAAGMDDASVLPGREVRLGSEPAREQLATIPEFDLRPPIMDRGPSLLRDFELDRSPCLF